MGDRRKAMGKELWVTGDRAKDDWWWVMGEGRWEKDDGRRTMEEGRSSIGDRAIGEGRAVGERRAAGEG